MKTKKMITIALFAALSCAAAFVYVPLPIGYANLGDVMVLLGAFLLDPAGGALAAGLGAGLADLLLGYAAYIPGTVVIKAFMALVAAGLLQVLSRGRASKTIAYILAALCGEAIMVGGYYVYESVLLGYGFVGAVASVLGNCLQGAVGAILACVLVLPLERILKRLDI